ncbi:MULTISPECIES: cupredoxin domain-containing protein [unclassified Coleofasciculus]|uniref:cupredoxin domain-containing protein n=1 Tax=unclassified Coleofasciculus TaxID=2692782 RepID=UPI00187F10D0|nr:MULTISPECIES: cupredoxin domain-containing protein [unclassified Coleofasciculus]MBE9126121.1 cupredoxin domain-containing protein [Coleofasciculus sp. LEGE 07081]MBE9147524.1 cupredoxin domain-containing protein [Coleofasciculus sp. LEGE 07092]
MVNKNNILGSLAGIGFLLSIVSNAAVAEMPLEMPASSTEQTSQFRRIEQPLALKLAVTLSGLGLIGLELWWFRFSKTKAAQADVNQEMQEMTIAVDGGYEPNRVVVKAGKPVRLNFLRRDPSSCLEKVLLPDFHIARDLELNHTTPVEFTPEQPGEYQFTCGMNMFRGVVEVEK